jgi:hypothetical protein
MSGWRHLFRLRWPLLALNFFPPLSKYIYTCILSDIKNKGIKWLGKVAAASSSTRMRVCHRLPDREGVRGSSARACPTDLKSSNFSEINQACQTETIYIRIHDYSCIDHVQNHQYSSLSIMSQPTPRIPLIWVRYPMHFVCMFMDLSI